MATDYNQRDTVWAPPDRAVDANGATFGTVQEAVDQQTSLVLVGPGAFEESVTIPNEPGYDEMTIRGVGRASSIDGGTDGPAIDVAASDVTVENVAVETTAGQGNDYPGIGTSTGADGLTVRGVIVKDSDAEGVNIINGSDHDVSNCRIEAADEMGIFIGGNGEATVSACTVLSGVSQEGIVASFGETTISGCRIIGVGSYGIDYAGGSDVVADGCFIKNTGSHGIFFQNVVRATASDNIIIDAGGDGIDADVATGAAAIGNYIDNPSGVDINTDVPIRIANVPEANNNMDGSGIADGTIGNAILENSSVTVAGNSVSLGGTTAVDHADLSNVGSSDHHAKYTDEEAQDAVGTNFSTGLAYDDATPAYTLDESVLKDGGAKELDAADLAAGAGAAGNFLTTNGSAASWANVAFADVTGSASLAQLSAILDGNDDIEAEHLVAGNLPDHATRHQDGGADELDAGDLSGGGGTANQVLVTDGSALAYALVDTANIASQAVTPTEVDGSGGTSGQVLQTDGTAGGVSWADASGGSNVRDSPNGHIQNVVLQDGESAEISVPVPDGETLTVRRWGGYQISDGTAPTGLDVELKDGSDTVQATANTVNNENSNGVASHTNSSGSLSIFKLAVANDTGSAINDPGVGAIFGYDVA